MACLILLISGPLAVGKTAVRDELEKSYGFVSLRSSAYLRYQANAERIPLDRQSLQNLGDRLDVETNYRWVVDSVARPAISASEGMLWLFDAVRKERQVAHFRESGLGLVLHVHFTAADHLLRERYERRQIAQGADADLTTYEDAINHDNERASRALKAIADSSVDLGDISPQVAADEVMVLVRALARDIE